MLVEPGSRERSTVPHGTCIMLSEICHGATMLLKPTCRSPVLVTTSPRRCSFESCVAIPKRGRGLVLLSRGVSGRFMLSMKPRQKPPGCVLPASRNDDSPLACTIVSATKSSYRQFLQRTNRVVEGTFFALHPNTRERFVSMPSRVNVLLCCCFHGGAVHVLCPRRSNAPRALCAR
jgi:hypothetical protein